MSIWSLTKSELMDRIIVLVRRLSGNPTITWMESKIISDGINTASIDLATETGLSRWRILNRHITATTTSGTQYVDLSGAILRVIQDTVRIEAEDQILNPATLEYVKQYDLSNVSNGLPEYYAEDVSPTDSSVTRLYLAPTPDNTYTIDLVVSLLPDEDDIDSYPGWFFPALLDKAMANSLRGLGFLDEADSFELSYKKRKRQLRDLDLPDGPITIARPNRIRRRGLESRIP